MATPAYTARFRPKASAFTRVAQLAVQRAGANRRSEEAALRREVEALRPFRLFFEAADESIAITDAEGRIRRVNPVFTSLFSWSAEEVVGEPLSILEHDAAKPAMAGTLWAQLVAGVPWQARVMAKRKCGRSVEVLASVSPIHDGQGRFVGALAVHRDLEALVQTERELRTALGRQQRAAAELERLSAQAQQASAAKSRFLATMSHEIRTPLNGVLGTLELLTGRPPPEEAERYAALALRSSRALLAVLNDVLDFSRVEAGSLELEDVAFDAGRLVREVRELFEAEAQRKDVGLELSAEPGECWVRGDAVHLRQILSNLVGNAVKFTERGRVKVALEARPAEEGAVELTFRVEDTGIGIPAERVGALFTPFVQAEASTHRQFGGSGLGLAISRRLAEAMGGRLTVESELGEGSRFALALVLPGAVATPPAPEPRPRLGASSPVAGMRVLLAEDNAVNQLVVSRLLERHGCAVVVASDGEAAVAQLEAAPFDVVLMDCQMPRCDGLEATRRIRASGRAFWDIPVIALTANAFAEDREVCLQAGMDGFLTKPVNEMQLVDALEQAKRAWKARYVASVG